MSEKDSNIVEEILSRSGFTLDDLKDSNRGPEALAVLAAAVRNNQPPPKPEELPVAFFSRSIPIPFNLRYFKETDDDHVEIVDCRCVIYLKRELSGEAALVTLQSLLSNDSEEKKDSVANDDQFNRFCSLLDPEKEPRGFEGFPKDERPLKERAMEFFGARRPFMDEIIDEIFLYYRSALRPTGLFR